MTYPAWICSDCGRKHTTMPRERFADDSRPWLATFHIGDVCGWCKRTDVPVTEPRDYGYPLVVKTTTNLQLTG